MFICITQIHWIYGQIQVEESGFDIKFVKKYCNCTTVNCNNFLILHKKENNVYANQISLINSFIKKIRKID